VWVVYKYEIEHSALLVMREFPGQVCMYFSLVHCYLSAQIYTSNFNNLCGQYVVFSK